MTGDTLLVCSPPVLDRLRTLNGTTLPEWADLDTVTDEQLTAAGRLHLVHQSSESWRSSDLQTRARGLGMTNDLMTIKTIEGLEVEVAARTRTARDRQRDEDDRAERQERAKRKAQRKVDAEELSDDFAEAVVATFAEEAEVEPPEDEWVIKGLLTTEGRVVLSATKKSGKTTLVLNLLRAMVSGMAFLGLFPVAPMVEGRTTCWLNIELTRPQAQRWIRRLALTVEQGRSLVAIHMRGAVSRYNLTSPEGRAALTEKLRPLNVQRLVVDPVAPLMTASGLKNGDDHDVGLFMMVFDRIAAELGISEVIYIHHVGKGVEEGKESAKGSTRWEDAADAIWLMGFAKDTRSRWFKAEGRDVEVAESPLEFDTETLELTVKGGHAGVGLSRRSLTSEELAKRVYQIVAKMPGINKGPLRGHAELGVRASEADAAIAQAVAFGWIKTEAGDHGSIQHWPVSGT